MPGCGIPLELLPAKVVQKTMVVADGLAEFNALIPNHAPGSTVHFQVYEPISCRKSVVYTVEF